MHPSPQENGKLKKLLLSALLATIASAAQAHTDTAIDRPIYVKPGSVTHVRTKNAFKTAHVGDAGGSGDTSTDKDIGLLAVSPGANDHDLIITAHRPNKTLTEPAQVLLLDDQGNTVEDFWVEVTPFSGSSSTVTMLGRSDRNGNYKTTFYKCGPICLDYRIGRPRTEDDDADVVVKFKK